MPGHPMAPEIGKEILCMTCGFRPRTDLKLYGGRVLAEMREHLKMIGINGMCDSMKIPAF
jgi:hypothetical protein